MKTQQQQGIRAAILLLLLLCCLLSQLSSFVKADPTPATETWRGTVGGPNRTPDNRSDARGTITTMVLSSIQQSGRWKAYVGNVTGVLTLDNPNGMTIYDWQISTFIGEVYASRYGNITWSAPSCAPQGLIINESIAFAMSSTDSDRLNLTFNATAHQAFQVGSTTISANTCNSTATYINDTRQTPSSTTPYQEVLIRDTNNYLVYMTGISDNVQGFDNSSYDFQMIVPENISGSPTPYYFYVELG